MSTLKITKSNLSEQVYEQIRDMILKKEIAAGERIPEEKIALQSGVSRTPIREALRLLSNQGLVKLYPRKYAEVVTLTEKEIKELALLRINLDSLAVQLAIQNGSNADFMRLKQLADECDRAAEDGDVYNRIKLDCDFHIALTEIGGNELLIKIQKELYLKVHLVQANPYEGVEDSLHKISHHQEIIKGLMERDVDKVIHLIFTHLNTFYKLNIKGLETCVYNMNL